MPMTLKDFVLVLYLVQNGLQTVMNYYVFITTPDTSWQLPIQCFAYCFGAEIGKKIQWNTGTNIERNSSCKETLSEVRAETL